MRAHTRLHTHKRAYKHKHAAKIMEKRPTDADDVQLRKGHNYTVMHIAHAQKYPRYRRDSRAKMKSGSEKDSST